MFEKAVRMKLRFDYRGLCSVEDLWDLSVKQLDTIYKKLNSEAKAQKEESLLEERTEEHSILDLKINLVKHIVEVKLAEKKAREDALEKMEMKNKILRIKAKKQDESLENLTIEELDKMMDEL